MLQFNWRKRKVSLVKSKFENWIRGLNTLVSNTQIKLNELSEAQDIQLVEDGKIQCPRDGQAYYGSENDSKVHGIFPYYKSDGTNQLLRLSGGTLQYYNGNTPTDISGATYTDGYDTDGVMAYDRLYLCNGQDSLTYYNGTDITTFTEIEAPGTLS